jgi:dihydrofolate reductase
VIFFCLDANFDTTDPCVITAKATKVFGGRESMLRVHSFAISIDGYGAGLHQDLQNPIGVGGLELFAPQFATQTFHQMHGKDGGITGPDNDFVARGFAGIGAWIIGRNMFGPIRGAWLDESWKGWWGDTPPYHVPVFVLTNHPRASLVMEGGTVFHFVTSGIHDALERAVAAAGGQDVRLGGGVSTIRQYLLAGLVDEMQLTISPVLLGAGERLFAGVDLLQRGYELSEYVATGRAGYVVITRQR